MRCLSSARRRKYAALKHAAEGSQHGSARAWSVCWESVVGECGGGVS